MSVPEAFALSVGVDDGDVFVTEACESYHQYDGEV